MSTYEFRRAYRFAVQRWLERIDFELFVTLAFPHNFGTRRSRQILGHWFACLDSHYLGKNWSCQPWYERTVAVAFPENIISNLHYHCLLYLPERAQRESMLLRRRILERYWTRAVPRGSCQSQPIYDSGAARYATKQLARPGYEDKFILASEFHANRE